MSRKAGRFLILVLGIMLLIPGFLPAQDIVIQAHLFRGAWAEGHPGLKEVVILTASSHPGIQALKAKLDAPQSELTAAVIDALMDILGPKSVEDLFSFGAFWDGKTASLAEAVTLEREAFLFDFTPKRLSPEKLSLRAAVLKTRENYAPQQKDKPLKEELLQAFARGEAGRRMEKILDQDLALEAANPVIIGMPSRDGADFLMIILRQGGPETRPDAAAAQKGQGRAESPGGPKLMHKSMPSYPEELRRQGVAGQVELQVAVDEEGAVQGVKVTKSLHPYLDNAAVQAVKRWTFEPAFHEGRPASWIITMAVKFDPEVYRRQEEEAGDKIAARAGNPAEDTPVGLQAILDRGAEYCRNLAGSALDYICEERINDVFYNFHDKESMAKSGVVVTMVANTIKTFGESFMPFHNPKKTERNKYICDYLIVKKGDVIEDRRIILEENGRKVPGREKLLEEKRFSALMPLLAPSRLLGKDRQSLFFYRLLKPDTIMGKSACVIEALPKTRDGGGISYGIIWFDNKSYQILKIEIEGVPLEGYESVLKENTKYNMEPRFTTTYLYRVEKNGLMFPGRMEVRVGYPHPSSTLDLYLRKIRTDVTYDKYKFFSVETESRVKK